MGLGSGRRVMKSPPLLIAVLIACVFVLGINYWITSTRCVELQNRVMELEGRIRRAAAERGAVEVKKNEFEDMLAKQEKQIDTIQSLHSSQMQKAQLLCKSEKEILLNNISTTDGLVQNLQVKIASVQKQLEDSKLELEELRESQAKKSSFELAQCSNKIAEVNEQCEEKIRRLTAKSKNAANEDEEKNAFKAQFEKPGTSDPDVNQKAIDDQEQQKKSSIISTPEKPSEDSNKDNAPPPGKQIEKVNVVDEKKSGPSPHQPKPQEGKDQREEEVVNEVKPNVANEEEDDELKVEDVEDPNNETENEEVERENLINLDGQPEDEKVTKEIQRNVQKPNDYNGDEGNEAESETEKQVELRANDQSLRGVNRGNGLNERAFKPAAEEGDNPRLK